MLEDSRTGPAFHIGEHRVGQGSATFIIAELSCNHVGSFEVAKATIEAIAQTGADAVKLQTDALDGTGSTIDCDNRYFHISGGTLWDGRNLFELYRETYTPWEWHAPLRDLAHALGLVFFSTPYSLETADLLASLDLPVYKIASSEATDLPLVEHVARLGKPMLISTGLADMDDIEAALATCRKAGNEEIALLKCTTAYPAPVEAANLATLRDMERRFGVVVGLSDHTLGHDVAAASVALGGRIIEKHVILDRRLGGPDAAFSMEPDEFAALVRSVRNVEKAIGTVDYTVAKDSDKLAIFGRSLFVVKDMKKGERFSHENVRSIRPGHGLAPKFMPDVLGRTVTADVERGTPLSWDLVDRT